MHQNMGTIGACYDAVADEYAQKFVNELDYKPLDRELLCRLARAVPIGGTVCDLGCGPGQTSAFLQRLGLAVTAVDASAAILDRARALHPAVRFEQGDMLALGFADASFDAVVAFYSIVNFDLTQAAAALREMARVVRPGGPLLLSFHVGSERVHLDEFLGKEVSIDFQFFQTEEIEIALRRAGFEAIEVVVRDPYPDEHPTQRAYLFARKNGAVDGHATRHQPIDSLVHHAVLSGIVERGFAPALDALSSAVGAPILAVEAALLRLSRNHGLVLHPDSFEVWVAHPFSLSPTNVWVATERRGWWAPCMWCALGVACLVDSDATIHTRLGGGAEAAVVKVSGQRLDRADLLVHFPLPPRDAWKNVIDFCATVLPFQREEDIDQWAALHRRPRGVAVPITQVQRLASAWYGRHLDRDWGKWSPAEAQRLFREAGLHGDFWEVPLADGKPAF